MALHPLRTLNPKTEIFHTLVEDADLTGRTLLLRTEIGNALPDKGIANLTALALDPCARIGSAKAVQTRLSRRTLLTTAGLHTLTVAAKLIRSTGNLPAGIDLAAPQTADLSGRTARLIAVKTLIPGSEIC